MKEVQYKKYKCCNNVKPITEYHIHTGAKDSHRSECRTCRRINRNHKLSMLISARQRAKRDNLPFDIAVEDINIPEKCPVFDIPLRANAGRMQDDSPSLDRLISQKGYIRDNITVISWKANRLKSNATPQDIIQLAKWLHERSLNG